MTWLVLQNRFINLPWMFTSKKMGRDEEATYPAFLKTFWAGIKDLCSNIISINCVLRRRKNKQTIRDNLDFQVMVSFALWAWNWLRSVQRSVSAGARFMVFCTLRSCFGYIIYGRAETQLPGGNPFNLFVGLQWNGLSSNSWACSGWTCPSLTN